MFCKEQNRNQSKLGSLLINQEKQFYNFSFLSFYTRILFLTE